MKLHIHQIPEEGLHIEGEDPASILDLGDSDMTPVAPIAYRLDVGMSDGGLFATGQLSTEMECTCVGCLERFRRAILVDDFACQVELTTAEELDLTDLLREDIVLALPPHPRCDWSGERHCPGVKLPQPASPPEDSETSPDAWGALDQLKLK